MSDSRSVRNARASVRVFARRRITSQRPSPRPTPVTVSPAIAPAIDFGPMESGSSPGTSIEAPTAANRPSTIGTVMATACVLPAKAVLTLLSVHRVRVFSRILVRRSAVCLRISGPTALDSLPFAILSSAGDTLIPQVPKKRTLAASASRI